MFPSGVVEDLRMLRKALTIRKVNVWLADKRVFFYKNDMDEHLGEGVLVLHACAKKLRRRILLALI